MHIHVWFLVTNKIVLVRGNWQIARRDLNNPRIIAMVSTDHTFLDPEYDEYAVSTSRSIVCCRTVAIIVTPSTSLYLSLSWCASSEIVVSLECTIST